MQYHDRQNSSVLKVPFKYQPANLPDDKLQVVSGSPFTRQLMLKGTTKAGNGTITVCRYICFCYYFVNIHFNSIMNMNITAGGHCQLCMLITCFKILYTANCIGGNCDVVLVVLCTFYFILHSFYAVFIYVTLLASLLLCNFIVDVQMKTFSLGQTSLLKVYKSIFQVIFMHHCTCLQTL